VSARLVLDGLEVRHKTDDGGHGRRLLSGVSLAVEPGEFVALVGSSGSGKTLTAMSCLRLLPPQLEITAGSIRLGDQDLARAREPELNAVRGGRLGMLFSTPTGPSGTTSKSRCACTPGCAGPRPGPRPWSCWRRWVSPTPAKAFALSRTSFRAAWPSAP
jgi:energy-coupling factor transporter ATP-binding protein EcfA2